VGLASSILGIITDPISNIVGKFVEDKDKKNEIVKEIQTQIISQENQLIDASRDVIVAEAQGTPYQRNWRPTLMYILMGLLVYNGVGVPLVNVFAHVQLPVLEAWNGIADKMWNLLTIGMGGYIAGRSGEKMMQAWSKK